MQTTLKNSSDDAVTITEAIKRLDSQGRTPARQSFYSAINNKKIREIGCKESHSEGKRMVSWASVCEYVAAGGFAPRNVLNVAPEDREKKETLVLEKIEPPILSADTSADSEAPALSLPESPLPHPIATDEHRSSEEISADPSESKALDDCETKSEPVTQPDCKKPIAADKPKGHRTPPLRKIKNSLRQLDFDQTKAIRDWADNRLLSILRPPSVEPASVGKTNNPQSAIQS